MKQTCALEQNRSSELYDEVERLRKEKRRSQEELRRLHKQNAVASNPVDASSEAMAAAAAAAATMIPPRNAEAEATIAMLQQELQDSNQAITDLKETLKVTIEEREFSVSSSSGATSHSNGGATMMNGHGHGNDHNQDVATPLFYAMEKQAELTQARDEIARLANLLGDAESSKEEAKDDRREMKRRMEDAQSRLQRQEQLATTNSSPAGGGGEKGTEEKNNVNLEYLKNIMLSYLNATGIQEKKALLPVIGTVLCLTHEEQQQASAQLEMGNSGSVMESVTASVFNLKWS